MRIIPFLALCLTLLRSTVREKRVRNGLIMLPIVLVLLLGFYKATAFRDLSFADRISAPSFDVVVVDDGSPLPGIGITAAEAAARAGRHPWMVVRIEGPLDARDALKDKTADMVVVPVRGGPGGDHVAIRSPLARLDEADLLRDLLLAPPEGAAVTGAPYAVRVVEAPKATVSGLLRFAAFYGVIIIAATCITTGATGFVVDTRKGQLRHLGVSPVSPGALIAAHTTAITALALVQMLILMAALALFGETEGSNLPAYLLVSAAGAALLTVMGYAILSFRPANDEKGAMLPLMVVMVLCMVQFNYGFLGEPKTDGIDWVVLANPLGALMELVDVTLTGRPPLMDWPVTAGALAAWFVLTATIAWVRLRFFTDADWTAN